MKCGKAGLVKVINQEAQVFRFRCKTWGCPHCQKKLRRSLIARAKKGRAKRLVTLTVNPAAFEDHSEAAQALVSAWRRARQQLKRHHGHREIEFLAVFEQHKSGWPHLHILVRSGYIPQKWLSHYMRERISSPIVDVRKVNSAKHAAIYVAKYIAKEPRRFDGCKRFWTSAHWQAKRAKPIKDPRAIWFIERDAAAMIRHYRAEFVALFLDEEKTPVFEIGLKPDRTAAPP